MNQVFSSLLCFPANEICDRFANTGFHANMITYLTQELNLPLVKAANTLTNFNGAANFAPLFGALISDSFAGRFLTIMAGSIIYELVKTKISCATGLKFTIYSLSSD